MIWPGRNWKRSGRRRCPRIIRRIKARRRISRLHLHQRQRGSRPRHSRAADAEGWRYRHARSGAVAGWVLRRHGHTVGVGKISPALQRLLDVTKETLDLALTQHAAGAAVVGYRPADAALRGEATDTTWFGNSSVMESAGGCTRTRRCRISSPPSSLRGDFVLRRGMTLAVEPMVVAGRREVDLYRDGWTVFTVDRHAGRPF